MNHANGNNRNGHASKGNGHGEIDYGEFGFDLGHAGIEQMDDRAGRICSTQRQHIGAANRPKIVAAREELSDVDRELEKVRDEESKLPPEGDLRTRRLQAIGLFGFAFLLFVGGFVSALYALEPFMSDLKKYFLAGAIAVILPFAVHFVINQLRSDRFVRWLSVCNLVLAFVAMSSLAFIRALVFAEQMKQANMAVVIDGDNGVTVPAASTFFQQAGWLMMIFSVFAAAAMEIASGLAFHSACRLWAEMPANAVELRKKRAEFVKRRIELVHRIEALEQEPEAFVNKFWRDFHEAQLRGCKGNRFTKMFAIPFFFLALSAGMPRAYGADRLNLVIGVDLTASVAGANGLDQKTELQRDEAAVGQVLASVPAGSRITVIGITDNSFAQPYVLLSARLDANEGYFHERIATARQQLVAAWQKKSKDFVSSFRQTDLLGALFVSSQLLQPKPGEHNVLVILSDMRHETRSLNLARFSLVPADETLKKVQAAHLVADLKGVDVYALGVDGAGKSVVYWDSLRDFWSAYFRQAGAVLRAYSMMRELPELAR